jgi:hypothetical protein
VKVFTLARFVIGVSWAAGPSVHAITQIKSETLYAFPLAIGWMTKDRGGYERRAFLLFLGPFSLAIGVKR